MSWIRSDTKLSQILRVSLFALAKVYYWDCIFYTCSVVLVLVCWTSGPWFEIR